MNIPYPNLRRRLALLLLVRVRVRIGIRRAHPRHRSARDGMIRVGRIAAPPSTPAPAPPSAGALVDLAVRRGRRRVRSDFGLVVGFGIGTG